MNLQNLRALVILSSVVLAESVCSEEYQDYWLSHQGQIVFSDADCSDWEMTVANLSIFLAVNVDETTLVPGSLPQEYLGGCSDGELKFRVSASIEVSKKANISPVLFAQLRCRNGTKAEIRLVIADKSSSLDFRRLKSACALMAS